GNGLRRLVDRGLDGGNLGGRGLDGIRELGAGLCFSLGLRHGLGPGRRGLDRGRGDGRFGFGGRGRQEREVGARIVLLGHLGRDDSIRWLICDALRRDAVRTVDRQARDDQLDGRQVRGRPGLGRDGLRLERRARRERRLEDVAAEGRRAGQAATLGLVPAVAARVLATVHAEVERRVERVQLLGRRLPLLVAPSGGHRLVHRRVVAEDVVLEALRQGLELPEAAGLSGRARLERVARSAALAEGLGEDLGHSCPRCAVDRSDGDGGPNGPRVYRTLSSAPPSQVRAAGGRWSRERAPKVQTAVQIAVLPQTSAGPVISGPSVRLRPRMGPLAAVERFLERLFERQTARLFKTAIRPIQVQRRLERAMEGSRVRDGSRTLVPYRFTVRMTPDDLAAVRALAHAPAANLADGP